MQASDRPALRRARLGRAPAFSTPALVAGPSVHLPQMQPNAAGFRRQRRWAAATAQGWHRAAQPYLSQLERLVGDSATAIDSRLDALFRALGAAGAAPAAMPLRQQVIAAAQDLAEAFNGLHHALAEQHAAIGQQRTATLARINRLNAEIAMHDGRSAAAGAGRALPADESCNPVEALAALVGVHVAYQRDGTRNVTLHNGTPLMARGIAARLAKAAPLDDGTPTLALRFARERFTLASRDIGGELGGLDDYEHGTLQPLAGAVRMLAAGLANRFNARLAAGCTLDDRPGAPLFRCNTTSVSALLAIAPGLESRDLAFAGGAAGPGHAANLRRLTTLRDEPVPAGVLGRVLLGDALPQLAHGVGVASRQNQAALAVADAVRAQAQEDPPSGRGLDEGDDAADLARYQRMCQDHMALCSAANALFEATLRGHPASADDRTLVAGRAALGQ
ncbi:hypothetical protein [Pseudorhodoferax sp. Leaf267]|uniref:FlgK family flagellar hook-associated protein n=1 Tax=Pseudorhodoferax sp. Leaf267 TaxID=1736316 RepID=UPI0006FDDE2B|nr:hypothetical protein [Pseudorhodoferax sp. Leaf267]KQP15131.1 hypothetical protein ASF43_13970 [Pseudorhodoferax sp. Leaf267]